MQVVVSILGDADYDLSACAMWKRSEGRFSEEFHSASWVISAVG